MNETLRAALGERFPASFGPEAGELSWEPTIPAAQHRELARALRDEHGFVMYVSVIATHHPGDDGEAFEVSTVLRRPGPGSETFQWCVRLEGEEPRIDSLVGLFPGADWQEREQYDLLGVLFDGHPDLRRLMLPEDWEGHPLRKDFPIDRPHQPWR
jgi:NADH-quinone oxidoreductase subunit C